MTKESIQQDESVNAQLVPLNESFVAATTLVYEFDELLPEGTCVRTHTYNGSFADTHTIVLVEENSPNTQLGYVVLQELFDNALWYHYMKQHNVNTLWVDKRDMTSLVQHRGIGSALWNISHRIIQPLGYRAIIDTSKHNWTKRKIQEAIRDDIFTVRHQDVVRNYGIPFERYLVQYT